MYLIQCPDNLFCIFCGVLSCVGQHAEVGNPVFNETFTFTLPAQAAVGYRLQFSVWCHQRTRANICAGAYVCMYVGVRMRVYA